MVSTQSVLVIILVTVLGLCCKPTLCVQQNDTTKWLPSASASPPARQLRQSSSSSVNNVNHRNSVNFQENANSPVSIVPSFSYQFHTNDHEHLDRIVSPHHQNAFSNSFGSAPSSSSSSKISNLASVEREASGSTRVESVSHLPNFNVQQQHFHPAASSFPQQQQLPTKPNSIRSWTVDTQRIQGQSKEKAEPTLQQPQKLQLAQQSAPQAKPGFQQRAQSGTAATTAQQNSNPSWWTSRSVHEGKYEGAQSNNSAPLVYSRPLGNPQNGNKIPITYQKRQQQMSSAGRAANAELAIPVPITTPRTAGSLPANPPRSLSAKDGGKMKNKFNSGKRKILSRADIYPETDDQDGDDDPYLQPNEDDQDDGTELTYDHDHNEYFFDGQDPQLRDAGAFPGAFAGFPPGPPVLPPPGGLPPVPPLKGSVDYILIPLILIGLAGPIFVVLYVVLGGFEYRIAPIARSLTSSYMDYQPYIDSLTSSVGRAVEKYECFDYATCRFRGFYTGLGLSTSTTATIESTLSSVTPKEYLPTMRSMFAILTNPEVDDCTKYQCSSMVEKFTF